MFAIDLYILNLSMELVAPDSTHWKVSKPKGAFRIQTNPRDNVISGEEIPCVKGGSVFT